MKLFADLDADTIKVERLGVMNRLGLGYSVLQKIEPEIHMIFLSSHVANVPGRNYGACASGMRPLIGQSCVTGYGDGLPASIRSNADSLTGTKTGLPIIATLDHRLRSGKVQVTFLKCGHPRFKLIQCSNIYEFP